MSRNGQSGHSADKSTLIACGSKDEGCPKSPNLGYFWTKLGKMDMSADKSMSFSCRSKNELTFWTQFRTDVVRDTRQHKHLFPKIHKILVKHFTTTPHPRSNKGWSGMQRGENGQKRTKNAEIRHNV